MNTAIIAIILIVVIGIAGYFIYKNNKKDSNNKSNSELEAFTNELYSYSPFVVMVISKINRNNLEKFLNGGLQYEAFEELSIDKIFKQVKEEILSRDYFNDSNTAYDYYKKYKDQDEPYKNLVLKVIDNNTGREKLSELYYTTIRDKLLDLQKQDDEYMDFLSKFPTDDADVELRPAEKNEVVDIPDSYLSIDDLVKNNVTEDIEE